jgi:undecaprenyl-diphosphatase
VAVGFVALCMLGAISQKVSSQDPLTRFDSSVLETLHRHASPAGIKGAAMVSRVGSPTAMSVLAVGGAVLLAAAGEWIVLCGWIVAFTGASLIDEWLKLTIHRPRPGYATALIHHATWSFPSGHAMGSLVGYGMLAYVLLLLGTRDPKARAWIVIGLGALIIAIGISRLYLGVHYFSDVVGGYAAGVLWLSACVAAVELARRRRRHALRLHPTG